MALAEVTVADAAAIAARDGVSMVNPAERLMFSEPAASDAVVAMPRRELKLPPNIGTGSPVLIGIIDVQGFDFTHRDFLTRRPANRVRASCASGTRAARCANPPKYKSESSGKLKFDYGSEIMRRNIDAALKQERDARAAGKPFIAPTSSNRNRRWFRARTERT